MVEAARASELLRELTGGSKGCFARVVVDRALAAHHVDDLLPLTIATRQ
jgi:hypothetical protein